MTLKTNSIEKCIAQIRSILLAIKEEKAQHAEILSQVHPNYTKSASNLISYRALRRIDITGLQKKLGYIGLSRIARSESHVVSSLQHSRDLLKALVNDTSKDDYQNSVSIKKSKKLFRKHSKDLFGYRSKGRRVRIMVTLPSEAAYNYELVQQLIKKGMNTARINCAHDGPEEWLKMIENVHKACKQLKKNCKIAMDLAGPKIRTGAIEPGPRIRKFRPLKNEYGQVVHPVELFLVSELNHDPKVTDEIPVDPLWLKKLQINEKIDFTDSRDKSRAFTVMEVLENRVRVHGYETSYVQTGQQLRAEQGGETTVGELPPIEQSVLLKKGDELLITKDPQPGRPALHDENGDILTKAYISCTSTEIFDRVKPNEPILFDDGKISGRILSIDSEELLVKITRTKNQGASLKADKGINLPESDLNIRGLTRKDREDLKFIVKHADVVNFSFVNTREDVRELLDALKTLEAENKIGIVLKVETQRAFNNLTSIILEGMQNYPLGVMIARGDLAVESGWENMARLQYEIRSLCHAGHVPVVWATQVLETLAKKGIPTRSEITDAASSLNAECVMLNKGPYILDAVKLLDYMLIQLNKFRDRNKQLTPIMEKAATLMSK